MDDPRKVPAAAESGDDPTTTSGAKPTLGLAPLRDPEAAKRGTVLVATLLTNATAATPFPDDDGETMLYPVLYARACGTEDAWLVLLRGCDQPCVVVPEHSPATDFLVHLTITCRTPPYARPDRPHSSAAPPVVQDLSQDPRGWAVMRDEILGPRHTPFVPMPSEDGDDGQGLGVSQDPYVLEWDEMVASMGDEVEWLAPFLEAELFQDPEPLLPLTAHPVEMERCAPAWRAGLAVPELWGSPPRDDDDGIDPAVVRDVEEALARDLYAGDEKQQASDAMGVSGLGIVSDDEEPISPYENPLALLGSGQDEDDVPQRAQRRLREEVVAGFYGLLTRMGLAPAPEAVSRVPVADQDEEKALPIVVVEEEEEEEEEEEDIGDWDGTEGTGIPPPDSSAAPPPPPSMHPIERALVEGRWYRMTIHEFACWRCQVQISMADASILGWAKAGDATPAWMTEAVGSRENADRLAAALEKRLPALCVLIDAQERLVAVVQETRMAAVPPREDTGCVVIDAQVWASVCDAANALCAAQRRCRGVTDTAQGH